MSYFNQHEKMTEWLIEPGLKIANCLTTKAFGFKEMYNNPKWHAGIPANNDELDDLIKMSDFTLLI